MTELRVGGLARLSTCDWPGQLVATVFCQGCGWRCAYCHNPHLLPAQSDTLVPWAEVQAFLARRRGVLDGVVFSGGEPLGQTGLPDAVAEVRDAGFLIGLHTAGPLPQRLAEVLPGLSWVGFDVKVPFDRYDTLTGVPGSGEAARESLRMVRDSGVAFETRTTVDPACVDAESLAAIDADLAALGLPPSRRQAYRPPPGPR
ncbi:anaerobic ribonucleoside-triphosphate reductase activating protein [Pararhodospirillum photometricum]|uniref:anaerobic ribonucleoside-triphosphate reductase activating protein n=1 Tax=Pararhodospirillum photometricum TaxID=1084 RepID=UPI00059F1892|nr:anaerobic ribonucleoside-triphosphate reductase activating protein [Pararhodospirillum photometricum]